MSTLTAHRDTRSLLTSLQRAGWGPLAGADMQGLRSVLSALIALLPFKSAAGLATVPQIADAAGLHDRWTRDRLALLEELGVIAWTRGGIVSGRCSPSWFRINKTMLCQLIELARPALDAIQAARRATTLNRIKGLVSVRSKKRRPQNPKSTHAAPSAVPRPLTGESPAGDDSPPLTRSTQQANPVRWRDIAARLEAQEVTCS